MRSKHLQTAGAAVVSAAHSAKNYTEKTVAELKSVPKTIPCAHCTTVLDVPSNIFDWICAKVLSRCAGLCCAANLTLCACFFSALPCVTLDSARS